MINNHEENQVNSLSDFIAVPLDFYTHIVPKMDIGETINKAMNERFDSVRSFANSIDKNHALVLRIMNGDENYTIDSLLTILSGLGLEIKIVEKGE